MTFLIFFMLNPLLDNHKITRVESGTEPPLSYHQSQPEMPLNTVPLESSESSSESSASEDRGDPPPFCKFSSEKDRDPFDSTGDSGGGGGLTA